MTNNKRPQPWLDLEMNDRGGEEWRDVVGFDGYYEVSNHGRVKSVRRYIEKQNRWLPEKIRKQSFSEPGFQAALHLHIDGRSTNHTVMRLVGEAFLLPLQEGQVYFRKNGNPKDSRAGNVLVGIESSAVNHRFCIGTRSSTFRDGSSIGDIARRRAQNNYGRFDIFDGETLSERECICCHVRLPISDFYANQRAAAGFKKRICKSCDLKKNSGTARPGLIVAANELRARGLKKCGRCLLILGLDHFYSRYRYNSQKLTYSGYCYGCEKIYKAERRAMR